ncbi:MAG: alpha/beta hydrolase [Gammaproteobacteria bacterium]|nr:alpha/beta hydrolase [Gammaproteobacteria bacterium]
MTQNSNPTIVLIPGLGNTRTLWSQQAGALGEAADVIVADIVGCDSVGQMADAVLEQSPSAPLSLVGFSLGGYVALDILKRRDISVARLALISASPYADNEAAVTQRQRLIDKARENYRGLLVDMGKLVVFPRGPHTESTRTCLVEMGEELGVDEFCRQQVVAMKRDDCCDMLATISVPTRILCGRNDLVTPVDGHERLLNGIAGATLEMVSRTGHLLPLERPDAVNRFLLDWLTLPASNQV